MNRSGKVVTLLKTEINKDKLNKLKEKHGSIKELREYSNGRVGAFFSDGQFRLVGLTKKKDRNVLKKKKSKKNVKKTVKKRKSVNKKTNSKKRGKNIYLKKNNPTNQTEEGSIDNILQISPDNYLNQELIIIQDNQEAGSNCSLRNTKHCKKYKKYKKNKKTESIGLYEAIGRLQKYYGLL